MFRFRVLRDLGARGIVGWGIQSFSGAPDREVAFPCRVVRDVRVTLCAAHTEDDVNQTLVAFRDTIRVMLDEKILARIG